MRVDCTTRRISSLRSYLCREQTKTKTKKRSVSPYTARSEPFVYVTRSTDVCFRIRAPYATRYDVSADGDVVTVTVFRPAAGVPLDGRLLPSSWRGNVYAMGDK